MFFDIHLGSVLGQICETNEYEKRIENIIEKGHAVNEVCGRGGGQRRGGRLHLRALLVGASLSV